MIIKVPFKTPTVNHLYWHRGNMKILTKEARELREKINMIVISAMAYDYNLGRDKLSIDVEIHEDWLTKKGEVARKDIANREKFLIDSVFKALGIDDKFIFKHIFLKVQDSEEFALINITAL